MIIDEILKLSEIILEDYKMIKVDSIYRMSFIYDFSIGKANALKLEKVNGDHIIFCYKNGLFNVFVDEEDSEFSRGYYLEVSRETALIALDLFLSSDRPQI